MDLEYGFSCMGYEIAGAWGAAMARTDGPGGPGAGLVTTLLGDGSYLMLNAELYSAAFAGHPFVAVVCDNGGYAVIDRLQGQGGEVQQPARRLRRGGRRIGTALTSRLTPRRWARSSRWSHRTARPRPGRRLRAGPLAAACRGRRPSSCPHPRVDLDRGRAPGGRSACPRGCPGAPSYDAEKSRQLRWLSD